MNGSPSIERSSFDPAPIDRASRLAAVKHIVAVSNVDALVVTNNTNIGYLSGFAGSNAALIMTATCAHLATDRRYATQAPLQLDACGADISVSIDANLFAECAKWSVEHNVTRVGIDPSSCTLQQSIDLRAAFAEHALGVELVHSHGDIERLRRNKDAFELERIERAARIGDEALVHVLGSFSWGTTERELAIELEYIMKRHGAADRSFESIVASGPNGALPHWRASNRVIERGDLVVIDFGALVDGYHSDMTRTVQFGDVDPELVEIFDVTLHANTVGRGLVAPGVKTADIDRAVRSVIEDAGFADFFVHGTGHGVGLDIHEAPRVSSTSDEELVVGDVVTIEPGIYLPGRGGVRVEDDMVVTQNGGRELTHHNRTPVVDP